MSLRVSKGGLLDVCVLELPRACTHFVTDANIVRLVRADPARTRLATAVRAVFSNPFRSDSKLPADPGVMKQSACHQSLSMYL